MKVSTSWSYLLLIFPLAIPEGMRADLAVEQVTTALPGRPLPIGGSGDSGGAVLSSDGRYVVFVSAAQNLLPRGIKGGHLNIYVRDRQTGTINLVSMSADGAASGDGDSFLPTISSDGRYVAFESQAQNLVTNATSGAGDIFLRDWRAGQTTLISINQSGTGGGNGASHNPSISADGRYIGFESVATNLVASPTHGVGDIFIRDTIAEVTALASGGSAGSVAGQGGLSRNVSISADGGYALFEMVSSSPSLSGFVMRDLLKGTNFSPILDVNGKIPAGSGRIDQVLMSSDGAFLVFRSSFTDLVTDIVKPGLSSALYWRDIYAGINVLIAAPRTGATGDLGQVAMSPNGRFVVFTHTNQVIWWDALSRASSLVSVNLEGRPVAGACGGAAVSNDGQTVAFVSNAPDLAPQAPTGSFQVYLRDMQVGITRLASSTFDGTSGSRADCLYPVLSADGGVVAFEALGSDLVPNDTNHATDLFVRDLSRDSVELISARDTATISVLADYGGSLAPNGLTSDARFLLFTSSSGELVPNDTNEVADVFLRDLVRGTNLLVSVNQAGTGPGNSASCMASMSTDARFVLFVSRATDLVSPTEDTNQTDNVYVRDMVNQRTTLVSVNAAGTAAAGVNSEIPPVLSADGRWVAFMSQAVGVSAPGSPNANSLILRDWQAGTTAQIASQSYNASPVIPYAITPGPIVWYSDFLTGNRLNRYDTIARTNILVASSFYGVPAISSDGQKAAFWTGAIGSTFQLRAYDVQSQKSTTLLTIPYRSLLSSALRLTFSLDGRYLAFAAPRSVLTDAPNGFTYNVFVQNIQQPGNLALASVNLQGTDGGDGASDQPRLSADGRFVVFQSQATDLVSGNVQGRSDIYLRDLELGVTRLISLHQAAAQGGDGWCLAPTVSSDGRTVAFTSSADDLVSGDFNHHLDPFVAVLPLPDSADTDHDGLPDDWELYYFGNLTHEGTTDSDGDGASDWAEFVAGTNPVQQNSVLHLNVLAPSPSKGPMLTWPASALRTYQVQYKKSLADPMWAELPGAIFGSGPGRLSLEDTNALAGQQRFYRVQATR
jgi:Tol biopolymer transport system component